jgi:hypothetical protein
MRRHQLAWYRSERPALLLLATVVVLGLLLAASTAAAAAGQEEEGPAPAGAGGAGVPHAWPAAYKVGNAHRGHPGLTLRGESFEVYTRAMRTKYAEVYNARQAPIPLPPDIVERFRGKVIGACVRVCENAE